MRYKTVRGLGVILLLISLFAFTACKQETTAAGGDEKLKELQTANEALTKDQKAKEAALKALQTEQTTLKADYETLKADCPGSKCQEDKKELEAKLTANAQEIESLKRQIASGAGKKAAPVELITGVDKLPEGFKGNYTGLQVMSAVRTDDNKADQNLKTQTFNAALDFKTIADGKEEEKEIPGNSDSERELGFSMGLGAADFFPFVVSTTDQAYADLDVDDFPKNSTPMILNHPVVVAESCKVKDEISPLKDKVISPMMIDATFSNMYPLKNQMTLKLAHGQQKDKPIIVPTIDSCYVLPCSTEDGCDSIDLEGRGPINEDTEPNLVESTKTTLSENKDEVTIEFDSAKVTALNAYVSDFDYESDDLTYLFACSSYTVLIDNNNAVDLTVMSLRSHVLVKKPGT